LGAVLILRPVPKRVVTGEVIQRVDTTADELIQLSNAVETILSS